MTTYSTELADQRRTSVFSDLIYSTRTPRYDPFLPPGHDQPETFKLFEEDLDYVKKRYASLAWELYAFPESEIDQENQVRLFTFLLNTNTEYTTKELFPKTRISMKRYHHQVNNRLQNKGLREDAKDTLLNDINHGAKRLTIFSETKNLRDKHKKSEYGKQAERFFSAAIHRGIEYLETEDPHVGADVDKILSELKSSKWYKSEFAKEDKDKDFENIKQQNERLLQIRELAGSISLYSVSADETDKPGLGLFTALWRSFETESHPYVIFANAGEAYDIWTLALIWEEMNNAAMKAHNKLLAAEGPDRHGLTDILTEVKTKRDEWNSNVGEELKSKMWDTMIRNPDSYRNKQMEFPKTSDGYELRNLKDIFMAVTKRGRTGTGKEKREEGEESGKGKGKRDLKGKGKDPDA